MDAALERIDGYTRPPGRMTPRVKCRDLTLLRSPLPASCTVQPLSEADVTTFFTAPPGVSRDGHDFDSETGSHVSQVGEDHLMSMEASWAQCLDTIKRQNERIEGQNERIATLERLLKAQVDPGEVQTSVLDRLGRSSSGKCSLLEI